MCDFLCLLGIRTEAIVKDEEQRTLTCSQPRCLVKCSIFDDEVWENFTGSGWAEVVEI